VHVYIYIYCLEGYICLYVYMWRHTQHTHTHRHPHTPAPTHPPTHTHTHTHPPHPPWPPPLVLSRGDLLASTNLFFLQDLGLTLNAPNFLVYGHTETHSPHMDGEQALFPMVDGLGDKMENKEVRTNKPPSILYHDRLYGR
jgi:hypothetical protein